MRRSKQAAPNQGRHEARCAVCKHARRQAIEDEFVAWKSPKSIAKDQRTLTFRDANMIRERRALATRSRRAL